MGNWAKNHRMEIGAVLLIVGLVLTVLSWAPGSAEFVQGYREFANRDEGALQGDWNILVSIIGPILLVWGGWYIGEQLILRRRFEKLIDTPKRSEFSSRRKELEETAKRLPDAFGKRVKEKESEFVSKRA